MPRFVILEHDHPFLHWDLMLEAGDRLRTWRLFAPPTAATLAEKLADHRIAYLDYEGPVSEGRGSVQRWDQGQYSLEEENGERLTMSIAGRRLDGVWVLSLGPGDRWCFSPAVMASPGSRNDPDCS